MQRSMRRTRLLRPVDFTPTHGEVHGIFNTRNEPLGFRTHEGVDRTVVHPEHRRTVRRCDRHFWLYTRSEGDRGYTCDTRPHPVDTDSAAEGQGRLGASVGTRRRTRFRETTAPPR